MHSLSRGVAHSRTPALPHSRTPALPHSRTPVSAHSSAPVLQYSSTPALPVRTARARPRFPRHVGSAPRKFNHEGRKIHERGSVLGKVASHFRAFRAFRGSSAPVLDNQTKSNQIRPVSRRFGRKSRLIGIEPNGSPLAHAKLPNEPNSAGHGLNEHSGIV
jgi:hypothetical protein